MVDCKKLRGEPYWNPNNYDLEFDSNLIPSNVRIEKGSNLEKRLQKLMPLGKIVHVKYNSSVAPKNNGIRLCSKLNIKKKDGNLLMEVPL